MLKTNYKNFLINLGIVIIIFLIDRISKVYVLNLAEQGNGLDIYITNYLNLYLIWNKGIAFGLFSIDSNYFYNAITILIFLVILIIIVGNSDNFIFKPPSTPHESKSVSKLMRNEIFGRNMGPGEPVSMPTTPQGQRYGMMNH